MSQDVRIKKKFIGNDAVDGEKILILNNQAVRAKKVDGSAAELYKLTDADKLRFLISPKFSSAPVEADDLSNKQYVDSEISFEEARALAAEASILSDLAVEIAARQAADVTEAAERQAADAAEAAAREAADYFEQQARISEDSLIRQEFAAADAAEAAARQAADAAEAAARQAADAAVLQEAKSYTDQEVSEEAAIRSSEDLTFLKLDGSRVMTGQLVSTVTVDHGGTSAIRVHNGDDPMVDAGTPDERAAPQKEVDISVDAVQVRLDESVTGGPHETSSLNSWGVYSNVIRDGEVVVSTSLENRSRTIDDVRQSYGLLESSRLELKSTQGTIFASGNDLAQINTVHAGQLRAENSDQSSVVHIAPSEITFTGPSATISFPSGSDNSGIAGPAYINFYEQLDESGNLLTGGHINGVQTISSSGEILLYASHISTEGNQIKNLGEPTDAQDAATKQYVDMQVSEGITDMLGQPSGIATLDASGKVPVTQLPNSIMQYQGMWDASTNSPMLSNSGNALEDLGDVYRVSVAGSVDFGSGLISFSEGDYAVLGAMGWEKSDGTDQVLSVNGQQGAVVLNTSHVSEFGDYRYYTSARQAAIEAMVDAEEARAMAREAELQSEIDAEEARALAREAQLQAEIDAEEARALAEEARLQGEIDFEAAARAAADSAETAARIAEDVRLQSEIDAEIAARQFADSELAEDIAEEAATRAAQDALIRQEFAAADAAEAAARQAADYAIDARLDIIEGDSTTEGSIAKAEADAKAYTDMEIAELLGDASQEYNTLGKIEDKIQFIMSNVDPAAIDSLTELLAAYQAADSNIYASLSALVDAEEARAMAREAELQAEIDAEEAARIAEDARIEAKVDAIQAVAPRKYTLTAQDIANQYIELPESAIMPHSVIANVDRLYLLPEELVQSTVSGKVRLTFAGAIASGGDQALVTDDVLTVRYWVRS